MTSIQILIFLITFILLCLLVRLLISAYKRKIISAKIIKGEIPTKTILFPSTGEWEVVVGSSDPFDFSNHHFHSSAQMFANDLCVKNSKGLNELGKDNQSYPTFGKEIISPISGEIVCVVDGIEDNVPGELNPQMVYGNVVMIEDLDKHVVVLAHFKKGSIKVKEGDKVVQGQALGQCGNSGNSAEPHIHIHIQSERGFEKGNGIVIKYKVGENEFNSKRGTIIKV